MTATRRNEARGQGGLRGEAGEAGNLKSKVTPLVSVWRDADRIASLIPQLGSGAAKRNLIRCFLDTTRQALSGVAP